MPLDSPAGLCPNCLLGAGLAISDPHFDVQPLTEGRGAPDFVPPKPHELADHFPQFEILDLLGYGGMGAVYKARQTSLDRLVALKIIKPDAANDPGFAGRFEREAKALAKLNHSNIVGVHDSDQSDGLYYFVMEYVDGTNLRRLIESKELPAEQAITIIPQVCEALQYAHDEGVVHRDIKPENILVDSKGRVKIADFGLAKLLGQKSLDQNTLTGTHQVMGTPRYMAPEQMEGSKAVDHRADIYSLGVVFYEMLTGELPMGSFEPPSRKVQVDVRLDEIVLRSLAKEPERRYQHASDVKTDVESVAQCGAGLQPDVLPNDEYGREVRKPAQKEESISGSELATVVLFLLFMGSVFGFWSTFMPWSKIHVEALPQAASQGLEAGLYDFESAGHRHLLPVIGSLLALVLFTLTLVKTIVGNFPSVPRAMLAAATGITLTGMAGLLFVLSPMPNSPSDYGSLLRRFGHDVTHSNRAMREVQALERQGSIDVRVDMEEPGTILSMLFGIALVVASMLEMRFVLASQVDGSDRNSRELVRGAADTLRWAAWSSPLMMLVLISLYAARIASNPGPDDWLVISLIMAMTAQGIHIVLVTPLILFGASQMQLFRSRSWGKAAGITAMLPLGISFVIGLPAGIWSLVVLAREDVDRAFDRPQPGEKRLERSAATSVRGPAIGMITAGTLGCIAALVVMVAVIIEELTSTNVSIGEVVGPSILCMLTIGLSGCTIVAGTKMLRLEQYEFVISFAYIAMLVPLNPIAVPMGIWSLVVLLRRDVKEAFGVKKEEPENTEPTDPPNDWSPLVFGLVVIVPLLALMAFGMLMTQSAWVLAALALPWLGLGLAGVSTDKTPSEKAVTSLGVITFLLSLGLIGLGIWIEQSGWPLAALAVGVAAAFSGMALAVLDKSESDESKVKEREAADEEDEDEDEQEKEADPEESLSWVVWWVGGIGAFRSWALLNHGGDIFDMLVAGESFNVTHDLLVELSGPVMVFTAIAIYQSRFYWLAFVGAALCFASGDCVPVLLGIWSIMTLIDPRVHALFLKNEQPLRDAAGTAQRDPPAKPPLPRGYGDAIGSTLGNAWTDWWRERDALFTKGVQTVLILGHLACLFVFLGFSGSGTWDDEGHRQFVYNVGYPSPWFSFETWPEPTKPFRHGINLSSSAWLIAAAGFVLVYLHWRIEKVRRPEAGFWSQPQAMLLIWGVLAGIAVGIGTLLGHQMVDDRHPPGAAAVSSSEEADANAQREQGTDAKTEKNGAEDNPSLTQRVAERDPQTAALEAIMDGNLSRVKAQLDAGASVNEKDAQRRTLLMLAIANGHRSLALTLIVLGADLTEQDEHGRTPLMYAVEANDAVFLSRLRELQQITYESDAEERRSQLRAFSGVERTLLDGRDFDLQNLEYTDLERQKDANGETASLLAARIGDWELYSKVATHVDSLRARDNQGRTIAMHAAMHGHRKWFEKLESDEFVGVTRGGGVPFELDQLALTDKDGKTALQLAEDNGHTEIANVLRRHLQAIVDDQTAEIEKGGEGVERRRRLRRLAWEALGETEKARDDADDTGQEAN
jgi:serine/threonine protein kinase/ankyrin repeat protein